MNIPDQPIATSNQIHTYTELKQQIHEDLRIQHPEWIEPTGECPTCNEHEARLRELLDSLTRTGSKRENVRHFEIAADRNLRDRANTTG